MLDRSYIIPVCALAARVSLCFLILTVLPTFGLAQDPPKLPDTKTYQNKPVDFVIPEGLRTPPELRKNLPHQAGNRCGPNALFIVLQVLEFPGSYDEVFKQIPLERRGSNMQEIIEAAEHFGLECEVRKELSPEDIIAAPKPVIVHLNAFGHEGEQEDQETFDHFAVITGYNKEAGGYLGIDTTNLMFTTFTDQSLARSMSGYAILLTNGGIANRKGWALVDICGALVVAVAGVANIVVFSRRRRTG